MAPGVNAACTSDRRIFCWLQKRITNSCVFHDPFCVRACQCVRAQSLRFGGSKNPPSALFQDTEHLLMYHNMEAPGEP